MSEHVYLYNEISGIYTLSVHDTDIYSEPIILYSNVHKQNKFIKYNNKAKRYTCLSWGLLLKKLSQGTFYYYNINDNRLLEILKAAPQMQIKKLITILPCNNYKSLMDIKV